MITSSNRILFACTLFITLFSSSLIANQNLKFVYTYDGDGNLLLPLNAADQCPDPSGGVLVAGECRGVLVDKKGAYSLRLADGSFNSSNLVFLANEYHFVPGDAQQAIADKYILLDSKRRFDRIKKRADNHGVDVNRVSEAAARALVRVKKLKKAKKGKISKELCNEAEKIDADAVNAALGNSQADNKQDDPGKQRVRDIMSVQVEKMNSSEDEVLLSLAEMVVEDDSNITTHDYIRKNIQQAMVDPASLSEIATRVYSHISELQTKDSNASVMLLEADKYMVFLEETAQLTTVNSQNAVNFFDYVWQGVNGEGTTASFQKGDTGSYLVCVTGEINNANDSSTDCVRMAVKDQVEAIARSSAKRIGTGNSLNLSASLSVGANSYAWLGSGIFTNDTQVEALWTAPQVPGTYTLTLNINGGEDTDTVTVDVFDVSPLAVAEAEQHVVYLSEGSASINVYSGSIASDGSPVESLLWSISEQPASSLPSFTDATVADTQFVTSTAGNYIIQLTANKRGYSDTTEISVQVRNPNAPVADAGKDQITFRSVIARLDGSNSYGPEGSNLSYLWSANQGALASPALVTTGFSASAIGEYEVLLDVTDGNLSNNDTVNISVRNRLPSAGDDVVANLLNEVVFGQLVAFDGDRDTLTYSLLSDPVAGGVTIDTVSGEYTYLPGGVKGCTYKPGSAPIPNANGGLDVPVIKLCADKYIAAPGEVINLTTSNSINASKFSGYTWQGGAVGDVNDMRLATFSSTEPGFHTICIVGNIGQSNNTSTACLDVLVSGSGDSIDGDVETGYIDSFTFRVHDGLGYSGTGTVRITIGWKNSVPQADSLTFNTVEESPVSGQLTATDGDDHTITYNLLTNGSLGSAVITDASSGAFTYTPNLNEHGVDTFTYSVNDGLQDSATATVTINIANVNDAPIAYYAGSLNTLEDNSVSGTMGATDADGDVLDFRLATIPSKGDVVITNAQTGTFTYIPHADKNGADSFFFVAHDAEFESNVAKVTIDIEPVNDQPVAQNDGPIDVRTDEVWNDQLVAIDVDMDSLVYKISAQPNKGSVVFDASTGEFTYTPSSVSLGADSFSFTASDAFLTSEPATVTFNVIQANTAPVADVLNIEVFESVPYGGALSGSDVDGQEISFAIVDNGRLGSVELLDGVTGEFVYRPKWGASGGDFFTFVTSDGDKTSTVTTVHVSIIKTSVACEGPGNTKRDLDNDGYADFIEIAFGTSPSSAGSTPKGLNPLDFNVNFNNEDDADHFVDLHELWMSTDYLNTNSKPSLSTLYGVPLCLSSLLDRNAPALFSFSVLTPTLDATNGPVKASFGLSAIDNAIGVKKVAIILTSPSGTTIHGQLDLETATTVAYLEFDSDTFNKYAEAGLWTVSELQIIDGVGNSTTMSTDDLLELNYDTTLTLINPFSDVLKPVLSNFEVLTPSVDLSTTNLDAQFRVTATDNLAGINHIYVKLLSPSGKQFQWGEVFKSGNLTNVVETITTNKFNPFAQLGDWKVSELLISDEAGHVLKVGTAELLAAGFDHIVNVNSGIQDVTAPQLIDFTVLTPVVDVSNGGAKAGFSVSTTDDMSGVREIIVKANGPYNTKMEAIYNNLNASLSLTAQVDSKIFPDTTSCGTYTISEVTITDHVGNKGVWGYNQLPGTAEEKQFYIRNTCFGGHSVFAYSKSLEVTEDIALTDQLQAVDYLGHSLNYSIASQPSKGSVNLINANTGEFIYTPHADAFGSDSFTFVADDGSTDSNVAAVVIDILPTPDDTIALDQSFSAIQNEAYDGELKATDVDLEPLNYRIVKQPSKGVIVAFNANTGYFQYLANDGALGADDFTFEANDSNSTSIAATVSITIYPELMITDFKVTTPIVSGLEELAPVGCDVSLSKDISAITDALIDIEGPSGQFTTLRALVRETSYPFAILNNIHTLNFPLEPGIWKFKNLLVKKLGKTTYDTVALDISAEGFNPNFEVRANSRPVTENLQIATILGSDKVAQLRATDPQNDALTYQIFQQGSLGKIDLINANTGDFRYTPHKVGVDSFTFIANDGLLNSYLGTVTVTISAVNGDPVAQDAEIAATENLAYIDRLIASDPDGDILSYNVVHQGLKGIVTFTDVQTGDFVYYPNPGELGDDSFTFEVTDGIAVSNTAIVRVTIAKANRVPIALTDSITVFSNVEYSGQLSATDEDGDQLSYHLMDNGSRGVVNINSMSGSFTYIPMLNTTGTDTFSFYVSDGKSNSDVAAVNVDIISVEQACGIGGVMPHQDSDGDGYVDVLEQMFSTSETDAADTPANLDAGQLGVLFSDDDDGDSYKDYVEMWLDSHAKDATSQPEHVLDACFDPMSDGIKPRLIGFNIVAPSIDVAGGNSVFSFAVTLLDNASGMKRARVSLLSPSGVYITTSASFSDYPLVAGLQIDSDAISEFAEAGTWTISSVTLYDQASNRLNVTTQDLLDAGYATQIEVLNSNSDTIPPSLDSFTIVSDYVYPGTADDRMIVQLGISDAASGVSSARVDFISPTGTVVSASQTLATSALSTLITLDTGTLSQHLEQGVWTVYGVLLVDAAGNSIQLADQLATLGFANTLQVTNPLSDTTAPVFGGLSIVTPQVYPINGDARMAFSVTVSDDAAGIKAIRIDIRGPSEQIIYAWGNYDGNYPLGAIAQVESSVLSNMLEQGQWSIEAVEVFDNAGNNTLLTRDDLLLQSLPIVVDVLY